MGLKNSSKGLFFALVTGGAMIANAAESIVSQNEQKEEDQICQLELHSKQGIFPERVICLDDIVDEAKLIEIINNNREPDCLTPFCGCWLG